MRIPFVAALTLGFAVVSCTTGSDVPPAAADEQLVKCSARVLVLHQEAKIYGWDSTMTRQKRDSLIAGFGYTEIEVQQAIENFGTDNERWKRFYAGVVKELELMQKQGIEER